MIENRERPSQEERRAAEKWDRLVDNYKYYAGVQRWAINTNNWCIERDIEPVLFEQTQLMDHEELDTLTNAELQEKIEQLSKRTKFVTKRLGKRVDYLVENLYGNDINFRKDKSRGASNIK